MVTPRSSFYGPRPALVVRVGVTGTRRIPADREGALRREVAALLDEVRAHVLRSSSEPAAAMVYAGPANGPPRVELKIVSPLAEGADRLVAEEALRLGFELVAPLPFAQAEYEKDFPGSVDAFRTLASSGRVIELDGARGAAETKSYEAVGRFVVRNCDLLIALWDGRQTGKQGGTAEITQFAATVGVPIWWIEADGTATPRWLGDVDQLANRLRPAAVPARGGGADLPVEDRFAAEHRAPRTHQIAGRRRPADVSRGATSARRRAADAVGGASTVRLSPAWPRRRGHRPRACLRSTRRQPPIGIASAAMRIAWRSNTRTDTGPPTSSSSSSP